MIYNDEAKATLSNAKGAKKCVLYREQKDIFPRAENKMVYMKPMFARCWLHFGAWGC